MYKYIILIVLFSILFCCGCEMSNLNNNTPTKLIYSDVTQLIGVTLEDIEKIYGTPDESTYYLNSKDFSKLHKDYVNFRDFNHYAIIRSYYNINKNDDYIILWYKNNKVIKCFFNEKDVINDDNLCEEFNNIDVKIDYFKYSSLIKNKSTLKKYKNFINCNLKDLKATYNLNCPHIAVNLSSNNKIIYFYDINKTDDSLCVLTKNNTIIDMNIISISKICEFIVNYI